MPRDERLALQRHIKTQSERLFERTATNSEWARFLTEAAQRTEPVTDLHTAHAGTPRVKLYDRPANFGAAAAETTKQKSRAQAPPSEAAEPYLSFDDI